MSSQTGRPERSFIDPHIHLFDLIHPELRYQWLDENAVDPIGRSLDAVASRRYLLENFRDETRFSNVVGAVHIQAAIGSPDPVLESAWLSHQADEADFPLMIVADARLQDRDVAENLDRQAAFPRVRGIRDFGRGDYLDDPAFRRGFAQLVRHRFSFDLDCSPPNLTRARDLARSQPETTIVLGHAGFPRERTAEYFQHWRADMGGIAEAENVVVKISGLGMADPGWTQDSIRQWVLACIEIFGTDRCMFASNWPYDRRYASYTDVIDAYRQITSDFTAAEKDALFVGNAGRLYGFNVR